MKSWDRDGALFGRSSKEKEPTKQRSLNRITMEEEVLCHGVEGGGGGGGASATRGEAGSRGSCHGRSSRKPGGAASA